MVAINNLYKNEKINEITNNILKFLKDEKSSKFKNLKKY